MISLHVLMDMIYAEAIETELIEKSFSLDYEDELLDEEQTCGI